MQKLTDAKIPVSNFILDDNWQSLDRSGNGNGRPSWQRFEADATAFPNGLSGLTRKIRDRFPGVTNISVWHAMLGYWGGISPKGELAKKYDTIKLKTNDGGEVTVVSANDVARFYADFYRFLAKSGIDGTKADDQVLMDAWTSAAARRSLTGKYFDSWVIAALRYLGFKTISCMSQFPRALFTSQLPQNRSPLVVRNSDDYFPDIADSHTWHVWANAHNSIFTQYLNVIPDWDMFQTKHAFSGFHAAARCVSGGPIYITDTPGSHDVDLINEMTAVKTTGGSIVLRPSVVGKSITAYPAYKSKSILKISSYNGKN